MYSLYVFEEVKQRRLLQRRVFESLLQASHCGTASDPAHGGAEGIAGGSLWAPPTPTGSPKGGQSWPRAGAQGVVWTRVTEHVSHLLGGT